jgi:hypothetical protein
MVAVLTVLGLSVEMLLKHLSSVLVIYEVFLAMFEV